MKRLGSHSIKTFKSSFKMTSILTLLMVSGGGYAQNPANPASVGYVDQQAAILQKQINNLPAAAPAIGSLYPNAQNPDGVVIYTDGHGHGIVAALIDAVDPSTNPGTTYCITPSVYGAPAQYTAFFGGSNVFIPGKTPPTAGNSNAILANPAHCTSSTDCAAFAANTFTGGYTGHPGSDPVGTWYLPSKFELVLVKDFDAMINQGIISAPANYTMLSTDVVSDPGSSCASLASCIYWSSTEFSLTTNEGWVVSTSDINLQKITDILPLSKALLLGVRAVHAFNY